LEPESWESSSLVLLNIFSLNDDSSAVRTLQEFFSVHPEYINYKNVVQSVYETSGINGLIHLFLDVNLKKKNQNLYVIAGLYNLLGMQNEALTYLEQACREREKDIPRMIRKPEFENLHFHPRFQTLVDTMNLRPYFHETLE